MEKIKHKLSKEKIEFLQNMQQYLDTKLYFYGSIQRIDYIDNVSDIDVCIFSENMEQTILTLQQFLSITKEEIKKFYIKTKNNRLMGGYKIIYSNTLIKLEISVYDEKYKNAVLQDFMNVIYIPYFYSIILYILKYIRMVIPFPYNLVKRKIINTYKKEPNTYFFVTLKNK